MRRMYTTRVVTDYLNIALCKRNYDLYDTEEYMP